MEESKQEVIKVVSLVKMAENLPSLLSPINSIFCFLRKYLNCWRIHGGTLWTSGTVEFHQQQGEMFYWWWQGYKIQIVLVAMETKGFGSRGSCCCYGGIFLLCLDIKDANMQLCLVYFSGRKLSMKCYIKR